MKKISLEKMVVVKDKTIKDIFNEFDKNRRAIKESDRKLSELKRLIDKDNELGFEVLLDQYHMIKEKYPDKLQTFLYENTFFASYEEEIDYNYYLKKRRKDFLDGEVDITKLTYDNYHCEHQFVEINNKLYCTKCSLKEDEIDFKDLDELNFLVDIINYKNMYIGKITQDELSLIELLEFEYKHNNKKESSSDYEFDIKRARNLDNNKYNIIFFDKVRTKKLIDDIDRKKDKILNNNSIRISIKKLLLEELLSARYEVLLLSGYTIAQIYGSLETKDELDALCKAIDNINNHKANLTYFEDEDEMKAIEKVLTTIPRVNMNILAMKKR